MMMIEQQIDLLAMYRILENGVHFSSFVSDYFNNVCFFVLEKHIE